MIEVIVDQISAVTLVGGGELTPQDLNQAREHAPFVVAADGGADQALACGVVPRAVIGDFDSLSARAKEVIPPSCQFVVPEQETTDFAKALSRIHAPLVVGVGFLGARMDHQLAALHVLVQPQRSPCILIGPQELVVHVTGRLRLPLAAGDVVSLFPMQPVTGRSTGLEWPIDGLELSPMQRIGTSNRALGPVEIETDGPGLLAIVPRERLSALVQALCAPRVLPTEI